MLVTYSLSMNTRRLTAFMVIATAVFFLGLKVFASTPEERSQAFVAVAQEVVQTQAFVLACSQKYPDTNALNQQAFIAWKGRNGVQDFDRVLAFFAKTKPEIAASLTKLRTSYVNLILKQPPAKLEPICRGLPKTLEQPNSNTIKTDLASELEIIAEVAAELDQPAANATTKPTSGGNASNPTGTLYSMAQLSALMSSIYDNTKNYADKTPAVKAKLKSLGTIYVKGTALEKGWMMFDQGKYQSKYKLSCSFETTEDSSAFTKAKGREVVISGQFKDFQSYFGVDLQHCTLMSNTSSLKPSTLSDVAGVKRKPLTVQEVMTKPGAGLKTSQIRGMYFYHKNNQRMDGFGNLYIDVDERAYLVLKDGSAYRYDWGFPTEDFDVAISRREEPKAWGRWNNDSYDGIKNSDFEKLLPAAKGLRFDRSYSITETGQGGSIREYSISFTKDGRFTANNSAMLAGFTQGGGVPDSSTTAGGTVVSTNGSGQTMVATKPTSSSSEGTYSFDGYTMILKLSDGSVSRNFVAIPSYAAQSNPKYLVYRGSFWFGSGK
jgi:hypothetical protein